MSKGFSGIKAGVAALLAVTLLSAARVEIAAEGAQPRPHEASVRDAGISDDVRPALAHASLKSVSRTFAPPVVSVADANPGTSVERGLCLVIALGAEAAAECGDLRLVHELPAVRTLSKERAPTLIYNSDHAQPYALVRANVSLPNGMTGLSRVTAKLLVNGAARAQSVWKGGNWPTAGPVRIALGFDASGETTNFFRYTLEVVATYGASSDTTLAAGDLVVVNRKDSYFGAGWWLAGLERLLLDPFAKPAMWVGGDGSTRRYFRVNDSTWSAVALDRPDTIKKEGARYARILSGGIKVYFDSLGRHVATRSRLGHETTFAYDASGRLDRVAVPFAPGDYRFVYNLAGKLETIESPYVGGATRNTTVHISSGRVDSIVDPDLTKVSFTYFSASSPRVTVRTDRRGVKVRYAYDAAWKVASSTLRLSSTDSIHTSLRSLEGLGLLTAKDTVPVDTARAYTRLDGPRRDVGDTTLFWLDRFGSPRQIRDAVGAVTTIARADTRFPALPTQLTRQAGVVTRAWYDARGNADSVTTENPYGDGRNATTRYSWDAPWDAVTRVQLPEGEVTTFAYDASNGNQLWQQQGSDPARRVTFAYSNSFALPSSVQQPGISGSDSLEYDERGNLRVSRTPLGYATQLFTDAIGRPVSARSPIDSAQTAFRTDTTLYDIGDRVIRSESVAPWGNGVLQLVVENEYDAEGNLRFVRRRSVPDTAKVGTVVSEFQYDSAGRKTVVKSGPFTEDWFGYDPAGNVIGSGRSLGTDKLVYDAVNRVVERTGQEAATFSYDPVTGGMLAANNANARITRAYFPNGAVKADTTWIANSQRTSFGDPYGISYSYDLNGRRTQVALPGTLSGGTIAYAYDAVFGDLGSVTDRSGIRHRFHYDLSGRLDSLVRRDGLADAIIETRVYDSDSNLRYRTVASPSDVFFADTLSYDGAGRVLQKIGLGTDNAAYDGLGHVTYAHVGAGPEEWFTVDALGNRAHLESVGGRLSNSDILYSYEAETGRMLREVNRSTMYGDSTYYHHLPSGDRTETLRRRYFAGASDSGYVETFRLDEHSSAGLLARTTFSSDTIWISGFSADTVYQTEESYRYDALRRRVWQRMVYSPKCPDYEPSTGCHSGITRRVWDGSAILYEIREASDTGYIAPDPAWGTALHVYGTGIDRPLTVHGSFDLLPLETWQGRFIRGTCPINRCGSGEVTFGQSDASVFHGANHITESPNFLGTVIDAMRDGSGYVYRRNRYLDPSSGVFTQADPIGLAGGLNTYGFANGDPVNFDDPFGLCVLALPCPRPAIAGAAAGGPPAWIAVGTIATVIVLERAAGGSGPAGNPSIRATSDATTVRMGRLSRRTGIIVVGGLTAIFTPVLPPSDATQTGANAPGSTGAAPPATEKKRPGNQKPRDEDKQP